MNRTFVVVGIILLLLPSLRCLVDVPYYVIIFYNGANEALVSQAIKIKKKALIQQQATQYLLDHQLTKDYYYICLGPYDSELEADQKSKQKVDQFVAHGFQVQSTEVLGCNSTRYESIPPTPINFGNSLATKPTATPVGEGRIPVSGYIRTSANQIKVRFYNQTLTSQKRWLLYEGWLEKGTLLKLQSEYGRVVYNYKYTETDPWSPNMFVNCQGSPKQATLIP